MPSKNAIVATILRIDPQVVKKGDQMFKDHPKGFSIEPEGYKPVLLPPGERAADILEILEELRRMQSFVYMEVHPDTNEITHLLIPLVVQVSNIRDTGKEDIEVELEISHARHILRRSNPDFEALLKTLRNAQEKDTWYIVTETDQHEIIDIREYPRKPEVSFAKKRNWLYDFFRNFFKWFWGFMGCISAKKARQMFDLVSTQTCDPLTVPPPCIPFLYPDDGCWGRAHEMCRLMIAAGAKPKKVWIYGSLHTQTRNNPNCSVNWGWHVAPTLCVFKGFFCTQKMVIDPSLFNDPVSKATWKGVQGDPGAQLVDTDASIFYRSSGGYTQTDPSYTQTAIVLATYRLMLKNRSISVGPPPYANCP